MKARLNGVQALLKSLSPDLVTAIGLGFILLLGVLDLLAPTSLSFTLFFLLGIGLVGWGAGTRSAALLAFLSALLLACHDLLPSAGEESLWTVATNAVGRLVLFGGAGWMVAKLALLNRQLGKLVELSTAQWKEEAERHKKTSERLAETLSRFEQVTSNISEVFWLFDITSKQMLYVSPGYEKIWGRPGEELYREPSSWVAAVSPEDAERVARMGNPDLFQKEDSIEFRIQHGNGELRWIEARIFPVRDGRGRVYRIAGIAQDITSRKRGELESKKAESLLQAQRDVGMQLSLTSDLETALESLLGLVTKLEGVDCGGIYLSDPRTGSLKLACHAGRLSPAFIEAVRQYPADSDRALLVNQGRPVYQLYGSLRVKKHGGDESEGLRAVAVLPLCHKGAVIGSLNLGSHTHDDIPAQTRVMIEAVAAQAAGAIARIRAETERRRLENQILEIADREKARLGQEIHDGLCQHLVTLAFDANSLRSRLAAGRHPQTAAVATRLAELLDQAITEARQLSRGLFPVALEEEGLPAALQELASTSSERFHITCEFDGAVEAAPISSVKCTHLYRIAQEAVTNAVKHGRPTRILISFRADPRQIELKIADDGTGLPAGMSIPSTGMGLHIIDYRARSIGGTFRIESAPGKGCVVSCCVSRQSS